MADISMIVLQVYTLYTILYENNWLSKWQMTNATQQIGACDIVRLD
jgi:hypothetical protein